MLQQTQTHRVIPKYLAWLEQFPSVEELANSSLSDVLRLWSGLGYNRRAKFLWEAANKILEFKSFPDTFEKLRELPGIGEYTANAVLAFAFNKPTIVIETNIRTAIIHHFFTERTEKVSDKEIKQILELVVSNEDPRNWYYALMDYGSWLKAEGIDHFHKQKSYSKQKPFKGSERFVRGYLLREVLQLEKLDISTVLLPGYSQETIQKVANDLVKEKLVNQVKTGIIGVV